MPTRNQIRDATPRCPGQHACTSKAIECGRLLVWNQEWAVWICEKHGIPYADEIRLPAKA